MSLGVPGCESRCVGVGVCRCGWLWVWVGVGVDGCGSRCVGVGGGFLGGCGWNARVY